MYKIKNKLNNKISIKKNRGMSYVELIVVLSIFSVLSSIVIFSYGDFQAKVDIKNLASDIALKIVEAQRSSLSGLIPTQTPSVSPWKPSYGVYFNTASDNKSFIYFVDLNNSSQYDSTDCVTGECISKVLITKGNTISSLDVIYQGGTTANMSDLTISFARPNAGATLRSSTTFTASISYVQITILSPKGKTAYIKLYPSGRVQVS